MTKWTLSERVLSDFGRILGSHLALIGSNPKGDCMRENNVIEFPKAQSWLARRFQRTQERRAFMVFSLGTVFISSMFLNQLLSKTRDDIEKQGRAVASIDNTIDVRQVKWEQELAKSISKNNSEQVLAGGRPSLQDQLVFGELEGKYGVKLSAGRISSLEFLSEANIANPKLVMDRAGFLEKYRGVLAGDFDHVVLSKREGEKEVYKLLRSDNTIVGEATFVLDSSRSVKTLNIDL